MKLPRPKLFNRRRDKEDKRNAVSRFCRSVLAFVTCGILVSTKSEEREQTKEKHRAKIVRKILKIRKNKVGVVVNTEDELLYEEHHVKTSNGSVGKGKINQTLSITLLLTFAHLITFNFAHWISIFSNLNRPEYFKEIGFDRSLLIF